MAHRLDRKVACVVLAFGALLLSSCAWVTRASTDAQGQDANGLSHEPRTSADGRYVVFQSFAEDIVTNDGNGASDVFRRDLQTGITELASFDEATGTYAGSDGASVSADGRYVLFRSIRTGVPPAGDIHQGLFVRDMDADTTTRVDLTPGGGEPDPAGESISGTISADGRFVVFYSTADDLVADDGNNFSDVFVRDLMDETTTRVSVDTNGDDANGISEFAEGDPPAISADGKYVAFNSDATDLTTAPDGNGTTDVFVRDLLSGTTTRTSVDTSGDDSDGFSFGPSLSADGRTIAFTSAASDLVAGDASEDRDVFVRDLDAGTTIRASVDAGGGDADGPSVQAALSGDAAHIAFTSDATDLVSGDTNGFTDVFVRDLTVGSTARVSVDVLDRDANGFSDDPSLTGDGRYVAFTSRATNIAGKDANGFPDVYVRAARLPVVQSIAPDTIGRGTTETFVVTGRNFAPDATVTARDAAGSPAGLSVDAVQVNSETELEVTITVAGSVPTGTLFVSVHVPGPGPGVIANSSGTCGACPVIVDPG
jgi:Tol biopolymer transport system component